MRKSTGYCPFSFDLSQLVAADLGCDRSSENRVRDDPAVEAGLDLRCDRSSENATGRLKTDSYPNFDEKCPGFHESGQGALVRRAEV